MHLHPAPPDEAATPDALDLSTLDRHALTTAQLVMAGHSNTERWRNTGDIVATYDWMLRDTGCPPGLRIYDTPRAATTFLHGLRLCEDRAEICQDPSCPGGDLGPAEARAAVRAADLEPPDHFALATTRYVMGYHPSPDEALETLAVYRWVVEARGLEAAIMPAPTSGADRNANRIDHAAVASTLLHAFRAVNGRDLPCPHCADVAGDVVGLVDLSDLPDFEG